MVGNNSPHGPFSKLPENPTEGSCVILQDYSLKRRRYKRWVESERNRERRRCRAYAGAHPSVNRADRRQNLRTGEVTVSHSGRESLKEKILFTRRCVRLRVRRLVGHDEQWIDDRVYAQGWVADLAVEVGVVADVVSRRRFRFDLWPRVHLRQPRIDDRSR